MQVKQVGCARYYYHEAEEKIRKGETDKTDDLQYFLIYTNQRILISVSHKQN